MTREELIEFERLKLRAEGDKLLHDTMKQLATISSAAIVIVVPFVQTTAQWKRLITVAFGGFLICTIAAGVCMRTISLKMGLAYGADTEVNEEINRTIAKHQGVENWAYRIAQGSFLLAIVALVGFVIGNMLSSGPWSVFH